MVSTLLIEHSPLTLAQCSEHTSHAEIASNTKKIRLRDNVNENLDPAIDRRRRPSLIEDLQKSWQFAVRPHTYVLDIIC